MALSLPNDIIFEILTRLPFSALARSRLVSSTWNRITYEPTFNNLHLSRTQTAVGYLIHYNHFSWRHTSYVPLIDNGLTLSLSFLPRDVKILACDRGIVLCTRKSDIKPYVPEYYVCKPTTKEFKKISNPKTRFFTEKIALVVSGVSPLRYKIIRITAPQDVMRGWRRYRSQQCEVYDSVSDVWRRLPDVKLPYSHPISTQRPIIVGEEVFWFASDGSFFVFDSYKETWEIRPLSILDANLELKMIKYEGKLCMLQEADKDEDFFVHVLSENKKLFLKKPYIKFPVAMEGSDVAVFTGCKEVIFYNLSSRSSRVVKTVSYTDVFCFCSDFEPCNLVNFNS